MKRRCGRGLRNLGAEQVAVEIAETSARAIRRCLCDDEKRQQQQQGYQRHCEPGGSQRQQRAGEHPADDPSGPSERLDAVRWLRHAAKDMAESAHRGEKHSKADADSSVVVNRRRMPEQPDGEQQHDHREREGDATEQAPEGIGVEGDGDRIGWIKPFDDRANHREQEHEERHAVAALLLSEGLTAEHPSGSAHRVGESEPGGGEEPGLIYCHGLHHGQLAR